MNEEVKEKKKHAGGRPSKFDKIDWEIVKKMYNQGFTDLEVCRAIGIDESTLTKWKQNNKEFFTSLKGWKEKADEKVEKSLYERAMGYEHDDLYITQYQGEIISEKIKKKYPPDPTSMIFWLKNRKPEQWRDKQEHSFEGIDDLLAKIRKKDDRV
jgi:hypothetical protein